MKKSLPGLLAVVCIALHTPVQAEDFAKFFSGIVAGVGIGHVQPTVTYRDASAGYYQWQDGDFVLNLDGSYHWALAPRFSLGAGLTYDLTNPNAGVQDQNYGPVETSLHNHLSVYVQPAWVLDNVSSVFARLGYHSIKVKALGQSGATWIDDIFTAHGLGIGFGYARLVTRYIVVQAEITAVRYEDVKFPSWRYQQRTLTPSLTAAYHF